MDVKDKLALIGALRSLGGSLMWSYTGFALYQYYKLPLTLVSVFYLVQTIIISISFMVGGYLADFLGRVRTMVSSAIASSTALIIAYIINRPILVVLMVLVQSFFNNTYGTANTALVGDYASGFRELVKYFSRLRVGVNAGWAIGPAIGGLLYELFGFRMLMLLGSIIPLAALPVLATLPEPNHAYEGGLTFRVDRRFAVFLVPTLLTFLVMGQLGFALLTYYNTRVGFTTFQVGVLYMVNGLLVVFLQDLVSRFLRRPSLIAVGMAIYGISYLAVAFIRSYTYAVVDIVFVTLAEMIVSPLSQTIANMLADPKRRGRYMGLYGLVSGIGRTMASSISSALMGYAIDEPLYLWGFVFAVALASAVLYQVTLSRPLAMVSQVKG